MLNRLNSGEIEQDSLFGEIYKRVIQLSRKALLLALLQLDLITTISITALRPLFLKQKFFVVVFCIIFLIF